MEAVELAIRAAVVVVPKLMGSEAIVGARVCDGEARESDAVSAFPGPKIDECSSLLSHRGTLEPPSWIKKADIELGRNNLLLSRIATEDVSQGVDHGSTGGSISFIPGSDGKQIQQKVVKVPKNGSGSFRKLRMSQTDKLLPQAEAEDAKMESDKLGFHLARCSTADKSQTVKQRNSVNGRRGDRRNSKAPMKAKFDPLSPKAGIPSFSTATGGNNGFGMYGLKHDVHDVAKLIEDISLDELLDGSSKYPTLGKDKGKKTANVQENILDSVRKACSILRLRGPQQSKQSEEVDIHVSKKVPLSSPSNISVANGSEGDETSLSAVLPVCSKDQESCVKAETPADMNDDSPLYQPRDILEKLALPPPKDLESLLQDAVKPAASMKLSDSRSGKAVPHRASLPPFPWSHNFNGHYKSNNDTVRTSNRSSCQGRWVRIRSTASFIGGGRSNNEGFVDLDSLTYDDSLVPTGQLKYRLPEIEKNSSTFVNMDCCQLDLSSAACPTASPPALESGSTLDSKRNALHSPTVLAAAQTLCDIASHCSKHNYSNGFLKWPKQPPPSQKSMKARKSRSSTEKPSEEEFLTPKSQTTLDHHIAVRNYEFGSSSSKKPKLSVVERRENFSHVQAVIGLSSVSAPRSNRSSPSRLSRDSVACNGTFSKPSFMIPQPPRVLERSSNTNHHPQKLRKVTPSADWNRTS